MTLQEALSEATDNIYVSRRTEYVCRNLRRLRHRQSARQPQNQSQSPFPQSLSLRRNKPHSRQRVNL